MGSPTKPPCLRVACEPVTIRVARPEDAGGIKAFAEEIHEEGLPHFRRDSRGPISLEAVRQALVEIARGTDVCGFVAEDRGQIIGTLEGRPLKQPVSTITHEVGISVHHDRRGRGVGGRLLDRALAWACDDARVGGLCGEIAATNVASIRLVESRGFWKADLRLWPSGPRETEVPGHGNVRILVYCRETPTT